jgi:tetratricopeptide (TPR) repeat protein
VVYDNPYYAEPAVPFYDYSQPIPLPETDQGASAFPPTPDDQFFDAGGTLPTTEPPAPEPDPAAREATQLFDQARDLFKTAKYVDAQAKIEEAIKKLPSDATLHEFRALSLFAQGKYKDSAAGVYAVLASGPGWDWDTMNYIYGDQEVYTQQLRALEKFAKENKDAAYAYFLLAYHYLVLNSKDNAISMLQVVQKLQPKDELSAALLKSLKNEGTATPEPKKE